MATANNISSMPLFQPKTDHTRSDEHWSKMDRVASDSGGYKRRGTITSLSIFIQVNGTRVVAQNTIQHLEIACKDCEILI